MFLDALNSSIHNRWLRLLIDCKSICMAHSLQAKVKAFRRSYSSILRKIPLSATSWEDYITQHWESCPLYCPAKSSEQSRFSSLASALSESPFIARSCPALECDDLDVQSVIRDALEGGLGGTPRLGQVEGHSIVANVRFIVQLTHFPPQDIRIVRWDRNTQQV
jgi:hypothetical protein